LVLTIRARINRPNVIPPENAITPQLALRPSSSKTMPKKDADNAPKAATFNAIPTTRLIHRYKVIAPNAAEERYKGSEAINNNESFNGIQCGRW
jgi:hypothetical protein